MYQSDIGIGKYLLILAFTSIGISDIFSPMAVLDIYLSSYFFHECVCFNLCSFIDNVMDWARCLFKWICNDKNKTEKQKVMLILVKMSG